MFRMKDILFEDCDIDVLGNPIDFNVAPGMYWLRWADVRTRAGIFGIFSCDGETVKREIRKQPAI
jgi:hypothetical protein